jgi:ribosomal protein S18 acetylase RimI-like enzyme
MMNGLYSRLAGRGDAEQIADLSRRTFYDSFAAQNTKENMDQFLNEQFTREKLLAEVGDPGSTFLLAYLEGELAGYARLREGHQPRELGDINAIEIARIYAEQNAIGKGVGKHLMQHCLEIAREKGKEWIWLGVWEHNRRAIEFYMKWGFEKFGEHIFVVGSDPQTDWKMKRSTD